MFPLSSLQSSLRRCSLHHLSLRRFLPLQLVLWLLQPSPLSSPTSSLTRPALTCSLQQVLLLQLVLSLLVGIAPARAMCMPRILKEGGAPSVATSGPSPMLKWFVGRLARTKLSSSTGWLQWQGHQWMVQALAMGHCHLALHMYWNELPARALKAGWLIVPSSALLPFLQFVMSIL